MICRSNVENINAVLNEDGLSQKERLIKLNKIAIDQMSILEEQASIIANNSLEYDEELVTAHLKRAYRGAVLAVQEETGGMDIEIL